METPEVVIFRSARDVPMKPLLAALGRESAKFCASVAIRHVSLQPFKKHVSNLAFTCNAIFPFCRGGSAVRAGLASSP